MSFFFFIHYTSFARTATMGISGSLYADLRIMLHTEGTYFWHTNSFSKVNSFCLLRYCKNPKNFGSQKIAVIIQKLEEYCFTTE